MEKHRVSTDLQHAHALRKLFKLVLTFQLTTGKNLINHSLSLPRCQMPNFLKFCDSFRSPEEQFSNCMTFHEILSWLLHTCFCNSRFCAGEPHGTWHDPISSSQDLLHWTHHYNASRSFASKQKRLQCCLWLEEGSVCKIININWTYVGHTRSLA